LWFFFVEFSEFYPFVVKLKIAKIGDILSIAGPQKEPATFTGAATVAGG
jgi:hypothetical protein